MGLAAYRMLNSLANKKPRPTHTSLALLDSLSAAQLPTIEIHMSNIHSREQFRHHSFVSLVASGMICGLGSYGYVLGLRAIHRILNTA